MIFPNPFPPDLLRICSHSVTLIPRVATESLRTIGNKTEQTDRVVCIVREPIDRWVSGYVRWLYTRARWIDNRVRWEAPHHLYYDVHTAPQWCQAPVLYSNTHYICFEEIDLYAKRCGKTLPHKNHDSELLSWCYEKTHNWLETNNSWREMLVEFLQRDYTLRKSAMSVEDIPDSWFE